MRPSWPALLLLALPAAAGELSERCPPSHALRADGTCEIVTLYQLYASPEGHGGVRSPLPPARQRYTPQQIDLGRLLFFDPVLSAGGDQACATCHQPEHSFADGRERAPGLMRNTPSLWNVAYNRNFMWDGRADSLPEQARLPLFSQDEMGQTPEGLLAAVDGGYAYRPLFDEAYGGPPTVERITHALAAFQSSLVSFTSRYDRYAHGDRSALTGQEIRGYNAFRGFVGRCSQCHIPPLFTDGELAVVGAPPDLDGVSDPGAGAWSEDPACLGAFKVPTLRNVTRTAPYFHAGQLESLDEVVRFYNDTRGHAASDELELQIHWHVHMTEGPQLSDQDMADIVAFLGSLEDETSLPATPDAVPSGLPVGGLPLSEDP